MGGALAEGGQDSLGQEGELVTMFQKGAGK
jgi:hypothetical protein